ncbi:Chromate resistance protein ChrB [Microbacterium indicum]|uniref:Chromate resistance protein ChrB n=1 Tax=Microbacterium indicum TaxID=358100 RepID=UPI000418C08B|nr:Chromate resistance protein ChrB [Microbacterium indicum]
MTENWLLAIVQVPADPSRYRVAVWRELRKAGAVPVSQGTWALPAADAFRAALERAGAIAAEGGGTVAVFDIQPQDDAARALIVDAFRGAREDEWAEFVADCAKFLAEIEREIAIRKFTFAELEEEEQSHERLRRWYRDLRKRDVLALPAADEAAERLRACDRALEGYAERVYAANRLSGADAP